MQERTRADVAELFGLPRNWEAQHRAMFREWVEQRIAKNRQTAPKEAPDAATP